LASSNQILFLLIQVPSTGRISGPNRSPKTVKRTKSKLYTDSKYALLILHAQASTWKKRKMLTTTGTASHRNKREVTSIVLEVIALVEALAGISYGVIASHVTAKKPNQSGRGHLKPGRPCY
jgi:hypothetical protein